MSLAAPRLSSMVAAGLLVASPLAAASAGMDPALLKPHLVRLADGRRIQFHCVGNGSPTVVFGQGGEGMMFNWAKVQPAVSALTRTCFYDRGGFGWSDPPRYPVTALTVTDELHAVLRAARVREPVILVGHSVGGFYATVYADRFRDQVAGLVLVDPGFSGQDANPSVADRANNRRGEGYLVRCAELARTGKLRADNLAENRCFPLPADASTDGERRYALNAITRPHWYEAEHSQSVNYFTGDERLSVSHQQARDVARPFGDLPVVVLSRGRVEGAPWRTADENAAALQRWRAGHAALAARSSRGRFTIVPGSGHFIQKDAPEAVIDAIREVVMAVRARAPSGKAARSPSN
jgi:pimeloyl-ACP methyl ester carboxylesterase